MAREVAEAGEKREEAHKKGERDAADRAAARANRDAGSAERVPDAESR